MKKNNVLKKDFFQKDPFFVSENLIGKYLVRKIGKKVISLMINEIELYDGFLDKASHASKGKTERNAPMFGIAGYSYVYLVYGMYNMLNIVLGPKGHPSAILIRGAGEIKGPGKLTNFLKIDRKFNNLPLSKKTGLWIEDKGVKISKKSIKRTPRIGVDYAGPVWAKKPYRFLLK